MNLNVNNLLSNKPKDYKASTSYTSKFTQENTKAYGTSLKIQTENYLLQQKEQAKKEEEYKKYLSDNFDSMKIDYKNSRTEEAKYSLITDRVYDYNGELYTDKDLNLSDKYGINPLSLDNYYSNKSASEFAEKIKNTENKNIASYGNITLDSSSNSSHTYYTNKQLVDTSYLNGVLDNSSFVSDYERNINSFNSAIETNDLDLAAESLEKLTKDTFGTSYNDGILASVFGYALPDNNSLYNKFNDNVTKLNTITDSIKNTSDANTLNSLNAEKNKLEFENLLINYNQLFMLESNNRISTRLDEVADPMYSAAKAFGDIEVDTSSVSGFLKSAGNGILQAVSVGATTVGTGWNALLQTPTLHMDDETARSYINVGTNIAAQVLVPGLAVTNVGVSGAQFLGTTSSYLTGEDSVLHNGESANETNVLGSALYFGANFLGAKSIGKLRSLISPKNASTAAISQGKMIASTILNEATSEGISEFAQTYGETLMYGEDVTVETFKQALINGLLGAAVSGGVTIGSMNINNSIKVSNELNTVPTTTFRTSTGTQVLDLINSKEISHQSSFVTDNDTANKTIESIINSNADSTITIFNNNTLLNSQVFTEPSYTKDNYAYNPNKPASENVEMTLESTNSGTSLDHIVSSDYSGDLQGARKNHIYSPRELEVLSNADSTLLDAIDFSSSNRQLQNEMTSFIYDLKNSESYESFNKNIYSPEIANYFFDDELSNLKDAIELLKKYPRLKTHEAKLTMSGGKENIAYVITKDQNLLQSLRVNKIPHFDLNNLTQDNNMNLQEIINNVTKNNNFNMNINNNVDTQKNYKLTNLEKKEFLNSYNSFIKSKFGTKANNISDLVEFSNMLNTNITRDISTMVNDNMSTSDIRAIYYEAADLVDKFVSKLENTDYIKSTSGKLVLFDKISDNEYRINNPKNKSNSKYIQGYVKGNNYISTNINQPVNLTNLQVETINKLLSNSGSSSRVTKEATPNDLLTVIKNNKDLSRNILQTLKVDGILDGTKLITSHNDFDNIDNIKHIEKASEEMNSLVNYSNYNGNKEYGSYNTKPKKPKAISNNEPINYKDSKKAINDIVNGSNIIKDSVILPKTIDLNVDTYNNDLNNSTVEEYISADVANVLNSIKITDKKTKKTKSNVFGNLYTMLFDEKYFITKNAKASNDLDTLNSISELYTLNNVVYKNINDSQIDNYGNNIGKSLKQIFGKMDKIKSEQFDIYMRLMLNSERISQGTEVIFDISYDDSINQANKILNKYPDFKNKAIELKTYTTNNLNKLVDAGIINSDIANDLINKYQYYVPIYSSKTKESIEPFTKSNNFEKAKYGTTIKSTSKKQNKTLSIFKALEINEYNMNNTILKNKLALNMSKNKNNYSGSDGNIQYYENGQTKTLKTSKEIVKAFDGVDTSVIDKIFEIPGLNLMPKLGSFKAKSLTQYNVIFQMVNPIRDFGDAAFLFSEYKDKFVKNYIRGIYNVSRNSALWNDFKRQNISQNYIGKNKYLSVLNTLESLPKFAEWISAIESGADPRLAKHQAQQANINMARGGWLTKSLNKNGVPFINSAMQGMDKASTSFGKLITNSTTPKGALQLMIASAGLIGPGVLNSMLLEDDENYNKLPYYMKNNYYFIPTDSEEGYIRIPKGRVQSLVDTLFRYGTGIDEENSSKDYIEAIWSSTKSAILPIDLFDSTLISEISNLAKNEDTFGNPIYEDGTLPEDLLHYALNNWGSVYGRTISDLIDDDPLTDYWTSSTFIFDSTKYDKDYGTVFDLVDKYRNNKDLSFEDSISKKYLDSKYFEINSISAEINDIKESDYVDEDQLRDLYQMRSIITSETLNNYKNYMVFPESDGNSIIRFDDISFEYNSKNNSFYKLDN